MNDDFIPYLCGGILFSFLIELHKDTTENLYGNIWEGKKVIRQHEIMKNLICAIKPDYNYNGNTLNRDTSYYHVCKKIGNSIIPFEHDSTRTEFDKTVQEQYDEVLERMTKFTSECFPTCTNTAVRILIERALMLIRDDRSIKNDTPFFINEDGLPISKEDLLKKKDFCFQSFLVGIWHYIITKPTKNTDGRQTFEKLFPKCNGQKYQLDTRCLKPYENNINVTIRKASAELSSKKAYICENMAETPKTGNKKKIEIQDIYYEGSLLTEERKKAILSYSPTIKDLNEEPDIFLKDTLSSTIYKFTTEFEFKTHFLSLDEEIIRLYCNIGSLNISGTTSQERWLSRSILNNMRFHKNYTCTAWFMLTPCGEEYSAEFLIIGRMIK